MILKMFNILLKSNLILYYFDKKSIIIIESQSTAIRVAAFKYHIQNQLKLGISFFIET